MTENWQMQTYAQDVADLFVAFPLMLLLLSLLAVRGSTRALVLWLGVTIATAYTFVICAFFTPFGHMYLLNVALLGLAGWSLMGALRNIDVAALRDRYGAETPRRTTGGLLVAISVAFYVLWLLEDTPATIRGTAPARLEEVGLLVNPIHVLDMAFLLPACLVAGIALVRGRPLGYVLAPALLTALAVITVGILTILVVASGRGDAASIPVAIAMGGIGLLQMVTVARFLGHMEEPA